MAVKLATLVPRTSARPGPPKPDAELIAGLNVAPRHQAAPESYAVKPSAAPVTLTSPKKQSCTSSTHTPAPGLSSLVPITPSRPASQWRACGHGPTHGSPSAQSSSLVQGVPPVS